VTDSAKLDLVRSIYAAWERGDFTSVEWAHPGITLIAADGPEAGTTWTGHAAVASGWRSSSKPGGTTAWWPRITASLTGTAS
jgi:hypothetical protein